MKICVLGLWHLGTATAGYPTLGGHHVTGLDFDKTVIADLKEGRTPLFEPGLEDLIKKGLASGALDFSTNPRKPVHDADVIWVAYDTPVDEEDNENVNYVIERVSAPLNFASGFWERAQMEQLNTRSTHRSIMATLFRRRALLLRHIGDSIS